MNTNFNSIAIHNDNDLFDSRRLLWFRKVSACVNPAAIQVALPANKNSLKI